jgi:hypothetical protein
MIVATPAENVRRDAAHFMRSNLPELVRETMNEIQTRIPEYARPLNEVYVQTVRLGVEQALRHFLDVLDDLSTPDDAWRDVFRAIGAGEMREGRSLDALHAAIRLGARMGWRRIILFADREQLPPSAIGSLAEDIFAHLDDIADACAVGYTEARAAEVGELGRRRRRLLELLVADPPASEEVVAAAAVAAQWPIPRRLAAVAVEASAVADSPPVLSPGVLVGLDQIEPSLIVPDPESAAQVRVMVNGLAGRRAAVGPPVPPSEAANSLRWARRALDLAQRGIIADTGMVWCNDHLGTLAIFQDDDLLANLIQRRLAPLAQVREHQRALLADTLLAWLQLNMNANAVATRLHVHPQTVRHRLRQIDRLFGDQVRDFDLSFELEIALRAERAFRQVAKPADPGSPGAAGPAPGGQRRTR